MNILSEKEKLVLCREALGAIRHQQEDLERLTAMQPATPEEALALEAQVARCRDMLQNARRQYPERLSMAMRALQGLRGIEYKVLWCYYILGLSNAETGRRLRYDCREVIRRKTAGLQRLERMEEP